MRILYFADAASIHTQRWARYFADHGCAVAVVSKREASLAGIPVHSVGSLPNLRKYFAIRTILRDFKPDILHAHYITSFGFWGALMAFHPFVLTGWGTDILVTPERNAFLKTLTRFTLRRSDLLTADAQNVLDQAAKIAGRPLPARLVQWGVDVDAFSPAGRETARRELGWSDKFIILSTRSLEENYNIGTIIDAFSRIAPAIPEAHLVIAGYGPMRERLGVHARATDVAERIHFTGALTYKNIALHYQGADLFISIPASDATSMSLLEAMACGLPVVVSDLPANHEWIEEGSGGFLVPPNGTDAVAGAIRRLHADPGLRAGAVLENRGAVLTRANHAREMERMMGYYTGLLDRASAG